MDITDIKKLALTARIIVSDDEAAGLLKDLAVTLEYIDQVNKAQVSDDDFFVPDHRNSVREDVVTNEPGSYTDAILAQAAGTQDGFVKVKKIL